MHVTCQWQEQMKFIGDNAEYHVPMDAKKPFGSGSAMTPKELVVQGLCGCTGMDVIGLLRKNKQSVNTFAITADVTMSQSGHPVVFTAINLVFKLKGAIDPTILMESVTLSQKKFCGVSAMLAKAVPIHFRVELNGEEIGTGTADFSA